MKISNSQKIIFNSELKTELRTLGHCLSVLEKNTLLGDTATEIRILAAQTRTAESYQLLASSVKASKTGKYSVWAVLGYLVKLSK